jgi:hypothetical protein
MMPTLMKQSLLACVIVFCFFAAGVTQTVFNAKTGVESWALQDELNFSGISSHPGQFFGFDVYVEKNRALFVPGFHYHRISIENEDETFSYNFRDSHHVHYFTIPMTFGYKFLDGRDWNLSAMGGGEISFFYDLDANDVGLDDDMFYGVWTGLTGVLQVEVISLITAEVKYHYGLQPIIKIRDDSKLRGWTLALGVKF